jgi:EmrB/QacA subfamily drug resistance transporter
LSTAQRNGARQARSSGLRLPQLAIVSAGAFLAPFDGSAVAVALPSISDSLRLDYSRSLWVQTLYLLVVASLLLPAGRSADRWGRVSHYAAGLGLFCVGSAVAGLAPGMWWLLAGRCCQGVGGALIVTTSAALAVAISPPENRGRALGFNTMCVYLGAATGPSLGGLLVTAFGWPSLFFFNAAVAGLVLAALLVMAPARRRLPRDRCSNSAPAKLGASLLLAATIVGILVPLTFGAAWGWASPRVVASVAVAGAAFTLLVVGERRTRRPLVDPQLYRRNRVFVAACAAALLTYVGIYAASLLTAVQLQVVQGLDARATGLILLVQPVMMVSLAPVAGRWYDRLGSRGLTTTGALVMALGALVLAAMPQAGSWLQAAAGLALVGLGLALFSTPNISAVLGSVAPDKLSAASAVLGTNRFVGQALSVGILGSIAASRLAGAGGATLTTQITATGGAAAFHAGYRWAMITGTAIALMAALVSASRGGRQSKLASTNGHGQPARR